MENLGLSFEPGETLCDRIVNDSRAITVICAPAGAGKSHFLNQLAHYLNCSVVSEDGVDAAQDWILWDDVTSDATLPILRDSQRMVVVCRENAVPTTLNRDLLYGTAMLIEAGDLRVRKDECPPNVWAATLGWRLLMSPAAQDDGMMTEFISTQILSAAHTQDLWRLLGAKTYPKWCIDAIPPLDDPQTSIGQRFVRVLKSATLVVLNERLVDGREPVPWLEQLAVENPDALHAVIRQMLVAGAYDGAVAVLVQSGGWYLVHSIGLRAFEEIVALFPVDLDAVDLVFARSMVALKEGEVQHGIGLLISKFGPGLSDPLAVLKKGGGYPFDVQIFRIVAMMYEDVMLTDPLMDALIDFASETHSKPTTQKGTYFNAMLEFLLRLRRYDEADEAAARALKAFERANIPLLSFYISIHRAVMRLMRGEPAAADSHTQAARQSLSQVRFESPGDVRLLTLIEAIQGYENGSPQALLGFLENNLDDFSLGEIWPSLVELTLIYGSLVLSDQISTRAALTFLDRWQLYMMLNRQFRHMIEVRKAQIMQNSGRWGEAELILSSIQSRLNRVWIESAESGFSSIVSQDEISLAMSWLRQIVYQRPRLPYLDRKLQAMRQNPRLTERQRVSIDIWSAYVARKARNHEQVRGSLLRVFEVAAQRGSLSILHEEQVFLTEMIVDQRLAAFLDASGVARAVRRRLLESRHTGATRAARATLTGQELKVLMMLTEGASNKGIARRLGLSEPTVKFHVKNLFRKLDVSRRVEAVATARSLGWLR